MRIWDYWTLNTYKVTTWQYRWNLNRLYSWYRRCAGAVLPLWTLRSGHLGRNMILYMVFIKYRDMKPLLRTSGGLMVVSFCSIFFKTEQNSNCAQICMKMSYSNSLPAGDLCLFSIRESTNHVILEQSGGLGLTCWKCRIGERVKIWSKNL